MKQEYEHFAKRLRLLAGSNASEFARALGLKQSVVHRYLAGSMKPGFDFFRRLDSFGININWLLSGKGSPYLEKTEFKENLGFEIETLDHWGKSLVKEFVAGYKRVAQSKKKK